MPCLNLAEHCWVYGRNIISEIFFLNSHEWTIKKSHSKITADFYESLGFVKIHLAELHCDETALIEDKIFNLWNLLSKNSILGLFLRWKRWVTKGNVFQILIWKPLTFEGSRVNHYPPNFPSLKNDEKSLLFPNLRSLDAQLIFDDDRGIIENVY